jgi:hypothetical protein
MWPRRKPDLIVPVKDRRQRRRILTLKNFRNAMIVLIVVFVIISIRSEMRGRGGTDYGRLVNRDLPPPQDIARKPIETVTERQLGDTNSADPFDLKAAAREQYLGVTPQEPVPLLDPVVPPPMPVTSVTTGDVAIVGDANGVAVVQTPRDKPQLGGGFGRP